MAEAKNSSRSAKEFYSSLIRKYPIGWDDPTIRRIDEKLQSEREEEKERKGRFATDFPHVSAIPLAGSFARWCYCLGVGHIAVLFVTLVLFTAIKAPFFSLPFTGEHAIKYSTYVEPAFHMAEKNSMAWYQMKYQSDPTDNQNGIFKKFGHLPIFEWGLFATYKALPFGSIETKTRIFTHVIGLMVLIFGYLFFRRWVPAKFSLILVFLMAINPVILFSTFVTVLDSLAIVFMFLSFLLLTHYFESHKISRLFWASIVFGVGIAMKYSMFLWVAPISFLLIYYMSQDNVFLFRDYGLYLFIGILCIVANQTSLSLLPTAPLKSIIMLFFWVFIYGLIYLLVSQYQMNIYNFMDRLLESKFFIAASVTLFSILGVVLWNYMNFNDYSNDYLTDSTLLFNRKLYEHMLRIQFKEYMTPNIFWLGMIGLAMLLTSRGSYLKKLLNSLLFGSLIYWVLASKAIFFHNYYTVIIMILLSLSATFVIYYVLDNAPSAWGKISLILLFLVLIFPKTYAENIDRLKSNKDISAVKNYIMENTKENEIIINETIFSPITIYVGRSLIYVESLVNGTIRKDIKAMGFSETMHKYHVKYLLTNNENPSFIDFAPLFADTKIKTAGWDRNRVIMNKIGDRRNEKNADYLELENIIQQYKIHDKFKLEAKFGEFSFYSFLD